jgi:hypothetical protein
MIGFPACRINTFLTAETMHDYGGQPGIIRYLRPSTPRISWSEMAKIFLTCRIGGAHWFSIAGQCPKLGI